MATTSRIDAINERRARMQASDASPLPGTSPVQVADSSAGTAPAQITYANSGIAPTLTSSRAYRQGALQTMNEDEFKQAQAGMNASDKEYWSEQARLHPDNTYVSLRNYLAGDETPEEKRKRERREQLGQVFSNLGNLIGNAANLYYTARGAYPADLNTGALAADERMQRIREKRDALKEKQDAILANAKTADARNAYNLRLARAKAQADAAEKQKGREWDLLKWSMRQEADKAGKEEDRRLKLAQLGEQRRHNLAQEGIAGGKAASKEEVAYSTKYGDVIFDNPKNKRAITLSLLETMRNGANGEERDMIDKLVEDAAAGDVDSYNKAELYVSQHLDGNAAALKLLYEYAKKYGRVNADGVQAEARRKAVSRAGAGGLGWGKQGNGNDNDNSSDW